MSGLVSFIRTIGWGVFCASSWTWCIGMFLPVILLERYGWVGYATFAIPNVLGCAGFGYVIRNRAESEQMVRTHGFAMAAFSAATIAFHVFFAGFAAHCLLPDPLALGPSVLVALGVFVLIVLASYLPRALWLPFAVAAYAISLAAFSNIGLNAAFESSWHGYFGPRTATFLIPVMLLGFLLCPYLDLTFHRARQHAPSHHAFAIFGVTFAVMIIFTCAYAPLVPGLLPTIVLVHIGVQLLFTSAAHAREIRQIESVKRAARWALLLVPIAGAPIVLTLGGADYTFGLGKDVYLRFIVIYGLVAPAYVLLVLATRWPEAPTPRSLVVAGVLTLLVSPCYELGFFHGITWLLVIPPIVLAVAGHFMRRSHLKQAAAQTHTATV